MKTAIIVLSDPKAGSEEALGRVFNALAVALEYKNAGETVKLLFAGTGTRWPAELNQPAHPAYPLYKQVLDTVVGVSCGCADVFGADDQGLARITTHAVPGTTGLPSLLALQRDGFQVLTF
jgi:DsrE/DsrF-like family